MADNPDEYQDDSVPEDFEEVYERHRVALYDLLIAHADEHDLSDSFLAQIVSDIGISLRMVAYASETEKPSVGGLRLDLDRFARELGDTVRDAKKSAAEFIEEAKLAREEEEREGEGGEEKPQ